MWEAEHRLLMDAGVPVAAGLSEAELARAESVIKVRFPEDLRAFLSEGLPIGNGFPDWRAPDSKEVQDQLEWPFEGMAFDIENNVFWLTDWGARPPELSDALQIAKARVAEAPLLIPLSGHRYLPAEPTAAGNPVFSVHQTDIILYGSDLATYFQLEFRRIAYAEAVRRESRTIRFWSDLTS